MQKEEKVKTELEELLEIYLSGKPTQEQWDRMILLLDSKDEHAELEPFLRRYWELQSLNTGTPVVHRVHFLRKWWWAAASVVLLLGAGAYLWTTTNKNTQPATTVAKTPDIPGGKNGAILTLADGTEMILDSLGNGVIAHQKGTQVLLKDGALAYSPASSASNEPVYNTMSTPKGRQFHVTLPDGTRVWLNNASSIRYPTIFKGKERQVLVTGEAYFEVAKNARMPFRVAVNNRAEVEVLGTHFNISAYENEDAIRTTLLEGKVSVKSGIGNRRPAPNAQSTDLTAPPSVVLKPGEQAVVAPHSPLTIHHSPNLDKVMAWKNGLFNFEGASLQEVMRQVERWYDIEVVYENTIPDIRFEGEMTRGVSLNGLLMALERSNVHFRIEGRKLIVLP